MKSFSLASAALIALASVAAAQGSILPYLPKDTIIAASIPDFSASVGEFAAMPLAKMWAEEEVQTFVADVKELVVKQFNEGLAKAKEMHASGAFPVDPEDILKLRVASAAFAVTKLHVGMTDMGPRPEIGFVVHLDFGSSAPTWGRLIRMGLGMMEAEAGNDMVKTESKVGDVDLLCYSPPAEAGIKMGLNVALVPNGVLVGTLASDVRSIVEAMAAKTPVLGATAQYQATAKHLSSDGVECEGFVRLDPLVDFGLSALRIGAEEGELEGLDMAGVERAIDAMGLRNLGCHGGTTKYIDGKCVTQGFSSNSKEGGATVAAKVIDTSFLKWVPKDAVSFGAGTLSVAPFYDTLVRGLQAYDAEMAKQVLAQLAEMEKQLGFNVRDDFFGAIGDHYITWSMPMGTISSPPELAFLLAVKDEAKLVNVLKNLTKLSQGMVEIEEGEKRGVKAYQVRVNFDPTQGMGGMNPFDMIQPTFAFKGGYMVLGFSASDVKRVFQRMDREDDPKGDIRSNREFAAVAGSIPAGVDSLSFTDWKSNFESLYQIATGLLAFVPVGDEVPINLSLLPDSGTLSKHLFGAVSYSRTTAAGAESMSVSPFGPEVALVVVAAIAAGAAVFAGRGGF
ncbi:MAG: hypothetical protein WAT39_20295 [Planctomycetota bacterium]